MKKLYTLLVIALLSISTFAQNLLHCGNDIVMNNYYALHPDAKAKKHQMDITPVKQRGGSISNYTIPVVFHILHLGGPENISDAQVKDALRILNRDFAKQNPDIADVIPSFQSIADSVGVHFVLATRDTNNNCTSGIIHYLDTDTDWNVFSPTLYSHTWNPTKYMNVYIVRTIDLGNGFGAAGYTYFPGSFADGDPMDAIVVLNNYFGSIGTGNAFLSRVLTHEVGHWLNLYHVFGLSSAGTDCASDDLINDTPATAGFLSCADANDASTYQLCTPGVDENYQNYMDYSYCVRMFTQGQAIRMHDALQSPIAGRSNLWSVTNLLETGITNPLTLCAPVADFTYNKSTTCEGVPVTFKDASWNGHPTTFNWSFPSGNPSSSTDSMPVVTYALSGNYSATLITSNGSGTSAPETKTNIITVVNNTATYQTDYAEDFETNTLPNNDWREESSNGSAHWEQSFDAAYSGSFSAKLDYTHNTRLAQTAMISPSINLSVITNPYLYFYMAAAETNPAHLNSLRVLISTDCEQSWNEIYNVSGINLITSDSLTTPFVPIPQSDWRLETISLATYATADRATFKFLYTRDTVAGADNIYIDNINIPSFTNTNEMDAASQIILYPNPAHENITISTKNKIQSVKIMDVLGQFIQQAATNTSAGSANSNQQLTIDLNGLAKGIYFVQITDENKNITNKKIIIQ